jgi:hypothetical protein
MEYKKSIAIFSVMLVTIFGMGRIAYGANVFDTSLTSYPHDSVSQMGGKNVWNITNVPALSNQFYYPIGTTQIFADVCFHYTATTYLYLNFYFFPHGTGIGSNVASDGNTDYAFSGSGGQKCYTNLPIGFVNGRGGFVSGTYYDILVFDGSGGSNVTFESGDYIYIYDTGGYIPPYTPPSDTSTRFIQITPYEGEATSTSIVTSSVSGYINATDLANANGKMVLTSIAHRQNPLVKLPNTQQIEITTSGNFYAYGTTSISTAGIYDQAWVLSDGNGELSLWGRLTNGLCSLGNSTFSPLLCLPQQLTQTPDAKIFISTSTIFSVGTLTTGQQNIFQRQLNQRNGTATTSPISYDLAPCYIFATSTYALNSSFSVEGCITNLIVPSSDGIHQIEQDAQDGFLTAVPWGYAMRIISMINASSSTSTLPLISFTFPSNLPAFGGMNFHFDPYSYMVQAKELVDTEMVSGNTGKNVWTIFMPLVNIIVALILLYEMLGDILGINFSGMARNKQD